MQHEKTPDINLMENLVRYLDNSVTIRPDHAANISSEVCYIKWKLGKPCYSSNRFGAFSPIEETMPIEYYAPLGLLLDKVPEHARGLAKSHVFAIYWFPEIPQRGAYLLDVYGPDGKKRASSEIRREWCRMLEMPEYPVVYEGKPSAASVAELVYFASLGEEDRLFLFGEADFSEMVSKELGFRKTPEGFSENLLVSHIWGGEEVGFVWKIPAPDVVSEHRSNYALLLGSFLAFVQLMDISTYVPKSRIYDDALAGLVGELVAKYWENTGTVVSELCLPVPTFRDRAPFAVVSLDAFGKRARELAKTSDVFAYLLLCALGAVDGSGEWATKDLELGAEFAAEAQKIKQTVMLKIGALAQQNARSIGLLDLSGEVDFDWDKDSKGNVYLNKVRDEILGAPANAKDKKEKSFMGLKKQ